MEKKEEGEENCTRYQHGNHIAFLTDDKRAPHLGGTELWEWANQTQRCLIHSLNILIQVPDSEGDEGDEGDGEGDDGDDSEGNNDDLPDIKLMSQS